MEEESEQHRTVPADQGIPNCTLEKDISSYMEGEKYVFWSMNKDLMVETRMSYKKKVVRRMKAYGLSWN